ncbi:hypothetical protein BURK1_03413 [Burkholderiales bacterium]|nr:hypothetical protein BURK1_03413 [Burkholderiales bacterium]
MNTYVEARPERHVAPPIAALSSTRWTSLAWTPFAVRCAPGTEAAANAVALAVHRAREVLARRVGVTVPVRVLVVDGEDTGERSLRPESTLWMPAEPAAGWTELARMLDDRLPHRSRLLLRRTMGRAAGPLDLAPVAHTLAIDAYAEAVAAAVGTSFPRRWIANAFGAYARVVTLSEADPDGLAAQAHLAETVGAALPPSYALADRSVREVVERIEATRDAVNAYARRGAEPLARFLRVFPSGMAPRTDAELARLVMRELGDAAFLPMVEALAA